MSIVVWAMAMKVVFSRGHDVRVSVFGPLVPPVSKLCSHCA